MSPPREWLSRLEVERTVDDRIAHHFTERDKRIDERLSRQDTALAEIRATQTANHQENRERQNKTEKSLANLLQLGENQLLIQKGRDEQAEIYRTHLAAEIQIKDERWARWKTRVSIAVGLVTLFSALGISSYLHRLITTGHLFPAH